MIGLPLYILYAMLRSAGEYDEVTEMYFKEYYGKEEEDEQET